MKNNITQLVLLTLIFFNFTFSSNSQNAPVSFADLAEKLIIKSVNKKFFIFFILILKIPNNKKTNYSKQSPSRP